MFKRLLIANRGRIEKKLRWIDAWYGALGPGPRGAGIHGV
jgi:hypothetical protein